MAGKPNTAWRKTMLARFGSEEALIEWQREIGSRGGKKSNPDRPKGFAANRELASIAGRKGGIISRKTK